MSGVGKRRWWIAGLLCAASILNYLDRQTLSILAPMVQRDLKIDDIGYAHIVQLFLIAYTIAYLVAGWLTDKLGTRTALALFDATRGVHGLTDRERELLQLLAQKYGEVVPREEIAGDSELGERTVDVHVGRLRKSLSRGREADPIRTVRASGYAFDERFGG